MRVSLAPAHRKVPHASSGDAAAARALLVPEGPHVILGGEAGAEGLARPISPAPDTLFGPRGVCLAAGGGPLFVSDTGHHRLLVWTRAPQCDGAPADIVIGQPDFLREGRNAKGAIGADTLNVPTGVCAAGGVLAVADAWNHRVLLWHGYPERNRPADIVLGQQDFSTGLANRGADAPRANTMHWCYGVAIFDDRLIVADTGNRRVLVWNQVPTRNGTPADLVFGQRDFITRDEGGGVASGAFGMRWPHGIVVSGRRLLISDAGTNRVMVWREWPRSNGAPCDFVLGQGDMLGVDHNRAAYYPTSDAMSMPYGICVQDERLVVADTANSRLVGFPLGALAMDARASRLAGQIDFSHKGDNRWSAAQRDSLCWPYGVSACGETLTIADSGNNRVLLWKVAP